MNSSVEKLLFRFGRFCNYKLLVCLWLRRCKETSVFAVAHILSHFFLYISLMSLFREFPAFTMFAISCHALFLPPEVIDEENFAFKITFLFSYSSNNTTFSLSVQFGFHLDIFYFQQSRIVTFKYTQP